MKRKLFIAMILVTCIIIGSLGQVNTQAADSERDSSDNLILINVPYQYPIVPGTKEWADLDSMPEKIAVTHVDPEILRKMSTPALVETVVTYPLFICVHAYETLETGVREVSEYFKGIEELCNRTDAREAVLNYINDRCPGLAEMKSDEEISSALSTYMKAYDETGDREIFYIDNAVSLIDYFDYLKNKKQPVRFSEVNLSTPNGTTVKAIYGFTIWDHSTPTNATIRNNSFKASFPNAIELDSINPAYNCHSFAWHQQSLSNSYWIESSEATKYMTDGSYSPSTAAVGRKVTYKNSSGNLGHSGVVSAITDVVYVTSKWEYCGLFLHKLADCPYYANNSYITYWN